MECKFKIGDELEVVDNTNNPYFKIGTIVRIVSEITVQNKFLFKCTNGNKTWYLNEKDVKLHKSNTPLKLISEPHLQDPHEPNTFKVLNVFRIFPGNTIILELENPSPEEIIEYTTSKSINNSYITTADGKIHYLSNFMVTVMQKISNK
jgi:hypothetical protein